MRQGKIQVQDLVKTTKSKVLYSVPSFGSGFSKEEQAACKRPGLLKYLALKGSGNEKYHTVEAITAVILLWAVHCQPQRVVEEKDGVEEAGRKAIRMGREGTSWIKLMIELWTNLSHQKPRKVSEKALLVVIKVRISQRSDLSFIQSKVQVTVSQREHKAWHWSDFCF